MTDNVVLIWAVDCNGRLDCTQPKSQSQWQDRESASYILGISRAGEVETQTALAVKTLNLTYFLIIYIYIIDYLYILK